MTQIFFGSSTDGHHWVPVAYPSGYDSPPGIITPLAQALARSAQNFGGLLVAAPAGASSPVKFMASLVNAGGIDSLPRPPYPVTAIFYPDMATKDGVTWTLNPAEIVGPLGTDWSSPIPAYQFDAWIASSVFGEKDAGISDPTVATGPFQSPYQWTNWPTIPFAPEGDGEFYNYLRLAYSDVSAAGPALLTLPSIIGSPAADPTPASGAAGRALVLTDSGVSISVFGGSQGVWSSTRQWACADEVHHGVVMTTATTLEVQASSTSDLLLVIDGGDAIASGIFGATPFALGIGVIGGFPADLFAPNPAVVIGAPDSTHIKMEFAPDYDWTGPVTFGPQMLQTFEPISTGDTAAWTLSEYGWPFSVQAGMDPNATCAMATDGETGRIVCLIGGTFNGVTYTPDGGFSWFTSDFIDANWQARSMAWGNVDGGLFVAVGDRLNGSAGPLMYSSPDGVTWTPRPSFFDGGRLNDIAWSDELGMFMVIGANPPKGGWLLGRVGF